MVIVVFILVTFMIAKQEYIKEKFNAGQNSVFPYHESSFSSQWWWLLLACDSQVCNFSDSDARSIFSDCLEEELLGLKDKDEDDNDDEERTFCSRASNTEPHYLSIKHWHSAEWKTDRKPSRELRVQSAPLKVKAIKAYYHDYSKK